MSFNFENFKHFTYRTFFESEKSHFKMTPRRFGVMAFAYALYIPVEFITWLCFKIDNAFYKKYFKKEITAPVFIIGNPRSGTTFLHRLMAQDTNNFNAMKTWEIFLAPSITMRKFVYNVVSPVDRFLGNPFRKFIHWLEKQWQKDNDIHRFALLETEEDEYLLIHIFSNLKIWLYGAMMEEARPYTYFDSQMKDSRKEGIMNFYYRCLQRHLFFHNIHDKHYLSKNPHFSPMIDTLYRYFPDVKIIYIARNPLDMIPSYISLKETEWKFLGDPLEEYKSREYILDMAYHWYKYPLERLEKASPESYMVVNFNNLVNNAHETITSIYHHFGLEISPQFDQVLKAATLKARRHKSDHQYSLEEMGLTREEIVNRYRDVFTRFEFDTREENKQGVKP